MTQQLTGVHHVSALSAHIGRTHDFYTRVLGMRPVIRTVNQDDPSMYHLFYGDAAGSPGSDMTVFDLPHAAREIRGNNSISLTTFRVRGEPALAYWADRLNTLGVSHGEIATRDGRRTMNLDDAEGTRLSLVDDGDVGDSHPWDQSPVPAEHQIRGLGYPVLTVPVLEPTDSFLTTALGLRHDHTYELNETPQHQAHVYTLGDVGTTAGVHAEVHVIVREGVPRARYGAGGVHHVALRLPEGDHMADWVARLNTLGYRNSGIVDRHYFTSAYVREPNGVLFELATDGPGFEIDGPLDGQRLSLPPRLESRRAAIEAKLTPFTFVPA